MDIRDNKCKLAVAKIKWRAGSRVATCPVCGEREKVDALKVSHPRECTFCRNYYIVPQEGE